MILNAIKLIVMLLMYFEADILCIDNIGKAYF